MEPTTLPTTLENLDSEVAKMPKISSKRILTQFDYGAMFAAKFKKSLENGTSPFLPKDGILKTTGAYNMRTNSLHHGISQLMLRERQAELGAPTGAFVSFETVEKAQKNGFDCAVKKGEHGFDILVQNPNDDKDRKTVKWFNESQIVNPENLRSFLTQEQQRNASERQAWLDQNKPGKNARDASQKNPGRENTGIMECTAKTPEEYLGQVFAAMSTGNDLKVSPEIADNFVKNTKELLEKEHKPGVKDKLAVFKLASKANEYCKAYCQAIHKEQGKQKAASQGQKAPEQKKTPAKNKTRSRDADYGMAIF